MAAVTVQRFGRMPDGEDVAIVTLRRGRLAARLISLGASVQAVIAPGRDGEPADVALGFASVGEYLASDAYVGSTVGRVANRIAGGRFMLEGREVVIPPNNGPNALHGGPAGFHHRNWRLLRTTEKPMPSVSFGLVSEDGDGGFPGRLKVTATYALDGSGGLHVHYSAAADAPTVCALSNHAYWNLGGEGSGTAEEHLLTIDAAHVLPVDAGLIPTGALLPVRGTPFDFRTARPVGERVRGAHPQLVIGRGYDHNWVVDPSGRAAAKPRRVARVEHPASGRAMEVWSDQPGVQFYSGNFLDGAVRGKSGRAWRQGDALVLEPQLFPDTVNRPAFGSALLRPGERYLNRIAFRFSTT